MGCSDSKATEVVDPILDEKPDELKEIPPLQQQEKEVTFLENCSVSQLDNEPAVSQPESIVNASELSLSKFSLLSLGEAPYERQIYKQQGFRAYQIEGLFRHNFYRSFHEDTGPLVLCRKLCDEAQNAANELAENNLTGHVTERHGQGFYTLNNYSALFPRIPNMSWYEEMPIYLNEISDDAEPNMDTFHEWGHYSQLCWKKSTRVGFAIAEYEGFKRKEIRFQFVVVARYQACGNIKAQYRAQVGKSQKSFQEVDEIIQTFNNTVNNSE
ncbi:Oidioi.mRNA.OKI2018_I69.XSR.g13672.t1.cds [Oikopleura dioica]|uniref:Oidioi.mRNA.OKI2018_I69.XSR.g13672.t1.cds n=1 Tax=Oikopleura dioica TaxID=34765 RepID=A0ABN7S7K9_OIKDI|nr:Oidioi.mRNA.OKI2018_I69.XSR.g13672.t1.cds [Oikopleura dioica]